MFKKFRKSGSGSSLILIIAVLSYHSNVYASPVDEVRQGEVAQAREVRAGSPQLEDPAVVGVALQAGEQPLIERQLNCKIPFYLTGGTVLAAGALAAGLSHGGVVGSAAGVLFGSMGLGIICGTACTRPLIIHWQDDAPEAAAVPVNQTQHVEAHFQPVLCVQNMNGPGEIQAGSLRAASEGQNGFNSPTSTRVASERRYSRIPLEVDLEAGLGQSHETSPQAR